MLASLSFSTKASLAPGDTTPWSFPCSDTFQNHLVDPHMPLLEKDWLSGLSIHEGKFLHLMQDILAKPDPSDTYSQPQVSTLSGYIQGIAFMVLMPSMMLIGYQMMLILDLSLYRSP